MQFSCCRKKYSTKDPETYHCIFKYTNDYRNNPNKEIINNQKVFRTLTYELACIKNGCTRVKVLKFSKGGTLLNPEEFRGNKTLSGKAAITYLNKIRPTAKISAAPCPSIMPKFGKFIPLFYGKGLQIGDKTQPRSLDEQMTRETIKSDLNTYTDFELLAL